MKKVIIFGVTQFAEILSHYIEREGVCEIAGYTVNAPYVPPGGGGGGILFCRLSR